MLEDISDYRKELDVFGIHDYQVKNIKLGFGRVLTKLLISAVRLVLSVLFALPGLFILTPLGLFLQHYAEKERVTALAGSTVKIHAVDVMASKKITASMIVYPITCVSFTLFVWIFTSYYW